MKRLLWIGAAAMAGLPVGSALSQLVVRESEAGSEIVIAASPVSIGTGVFAGRLYRMRGPLVAFIAGANVSAIL